ncbi:hypothetical protein C0995_000006 [Termitomyces sp. Mi166|nr:hypothetical protein C0995_000006 [Termitomyces sp. Mi166\
MASHLSAQHTRYSHSSPQNPREEDALRLPSIKDLGFRYPSRRVQDPQDVSSHTTSIVPADTSINRDVQDNSGRWSRHALQSQSPASVPAHLQAQHHHHQQQLTPPLSAGHEPPQPKNEYSSKSDGPFMTPGLPLSAQSIPVHGSATIGPGTRGDEADQSKRRRSSVNMSTPRDQRSSHTAYPPHYAQYPPSQPPQQTYQMQPPMSHPGPPVQQPIDHVAAQQVAPPPHPGYSAYQPYPPPPSRIQLHSAPQQQQVPPPGNPYPPAPAPPPHNPWEQPHHVQPPPHQHQPPPPHHHQPPPPHHHQPPPPHQHQPPPPHQHQPPPPPHQHQPPPPPHQHQPPPPPPPPPHQHQPPPPPQLQQPPAHLPPPQHASQIQQPPHSVPQHPQPPPPPPPLLPQHHHMHPQHPQPHPSQQPIAPPPLGHHAQPQPQPHQAPPQIQQPQIPYARTTAIVPIDTRSQYPFADERMPVSIRDSTMNEASRIMKHCQVLFDFASRYAQIQQSIPDVSPLPEEMQEMSHRAAEVVRLLEEYRRLNLPESERVKMDSSMAMTPPDDHRPPKRPWEDISQDENSTLVESTTFAEQQYPTPIENKSQSTAEQDMEIIRTKRATSAAGGSGSSGQPKSKYRKRSRATPPGKCHSCNIRETPEWRRGPDGARTLCNACGLHYAKLQRKREKQAGPNGEALPRIDMETLRASARAAEVDKLTTRTKNGRSQQSNESTSPMEPGKPLPQQHHQSSFQLVPMVVTEDPVPAPPPPPSQQQQSTLGSAPTPPWQASVQQPPSTVRAYAPDQLQHQSFIRTSHQANHTPAR